MDTHDDDITASLHRDTGIRPQAPADSYLLARLHALEEENRALRAVAEDKRNLDAMVARLREANENLVLATIDAQRLKEDAEDANRRQNEFLAMLAHELRNPLSPISMAASMLERMPDPTPQLRNLSGLIARQVNHMGKLLDDLLDAARISSGKVKLSTRPLLLGEILQQAIETVQPSIQERAQTLSVDYPELAIVVEADQVRLVQVFANLLGNASKYTGNGGALRLRAETGNDWVSVSVEDNGVGLAPEIVPYIFDLFTQGPRSLDRAEGGLGIGLNVVRNLVVMHGGSVECHSGGAGAGSRFTVRLPQVHRAPASSDSCQVRATGGRRVLVIEDNPDTNEILAACLRTEGHEVWTALDGRAGLAAALEKPHDVILCDIGLPGIDGIELIRAVRASLRHTPPLAIALTGYGQSEDRQRGLDAGFDDYLIKPVALDALLARVAACPARSPAAD